MTENNQSANDQQFDYGNDVNIDISALDSTEQPFPFYGAGLARHFENAWIDIKFLSAPNKETIKKIVESAPQIMEVTKKDFHDSVFTTFSGISINSKIEVMYSTEEEAEEVIANMESLDDNCSDEKLLAFEMDIIRWLLEIHAYCPIQFVVREEDGEAGGIVFSKWHHESLEIDKLDEALEMEIERCSKKEKEHLEGMADIINGYWEDSEWGQSEDDENDDDEDYSDDKPDENNFYQDMRKEIEGMSSDEIINHIKEKYSSPASIAKLVVAVVQNNDSELLHSITMAIYQHENLTGMIAHVAYKASQYFYENWALVVRLYEYVFYLLDGKDFNDLSLYCNALYACQYDNTGLPVNAGLNYRFLNACLPYAEKNHPIWFNAGMLYVEMNEYDEALKLFKKYFATNDSNKASLINSIKTDKAFAEFRKQKEVTEFISKLK